MAVAVTSHFVAGPRDISHQSRKSLCDQAQYEECPASTGVVKELEEGLCVSHDTLCNRQTPVQRRLLPVFDINTE